MLKRGVWKEGKFYPDNTPVEVPLKFRNNGGDPLHVLVARAMADISRNAEREGRESILEANDFSVREDGEEFGDISKHSFTEMEEESMVEGIRGLRDDPDIKENEHGEGESGREGFDRGGASDGEAGAGRLRKGAGKAVGKDKHRRDSGSAEEGSEGAAKSE